jgi:hypothetical protein
MRPGPTAWSSIASRRAARGVAAKASAGAVARGCRDVVNIARALECLKQAGVWTIAGGDAPKRYDDWTSRRRRWWRPEGRGYAAGAGSV